MAELVLDLPLSVPLAPQLVGIVPPRVTLVSAPVAVLRLYLPVAGLVVVEIARQVMPKTGSLIWNAAPMTFVAVLVILGRVPVKDAYWTLQGSVSFRMVALPWGQVPMVAALTAPISPPLVLVMVADLRVPSSVRLHLPVPNPPANSADVQLALKVMLLDLRFLAVAVVVSAARRVMVVVSARSVFVGCIVPASQGGALACSEW